MDSTENEIIIIVGGGIAGSGLASFARRRRPAGDGAGANDGLS